MHSPVEDSGIYKLIKSIDPESAQNLIRASNIAKPILANVNIYFGEHPDHSIKHSLRIIERIEQLLLLEDIIEFAEKNPTAKDEIVRILKDRTGLNIYDLYFLVLGVLFHDIGMSPDREIFRKIAKEVLGDEKDWDELSKGERDKVRKYIKDNHGKLSNKMLLKLSDKLEKELELSKTHIKLLGKICEGHKVEIENILSFVGDFRDAFFKGEKLHVIPIILLLQLGDDLDVTKDRTPDIIYDLYIKDFTPEDIENRWKSHLSVEDICRKGNVIYISGYCDDPKAYEMFLNYINKTVKKKLEVIHDILQGLDDVGDKLEEVLPSVVRDKIHKEGFKAVGLRLEFSGQNLLGLLSRRLYGYDWTVVIRELLLNAIDACKFRALREFEKGNYDYKPRIDIEFKDGVLIVKDNGKGMTLDEIREFLLNIGKSYYKETLSREEFEELNLTSLFGIGILSCFMLGDKIEIITKPMDRDEAYRVEIYEDISRSIIVWERDKDDIGTEVRINVKEDIVKEGKLRYAPWNIANHQHLKGIVNHWIIDTRYKIKDREVSIIICCNGDCWTPNIKTRFKEIKDGWHSILDFKYTDENCEAYIVIHREVRDPAVYLAYNGIFCEHMSLRFLLNEIAAPFDNLYVNSIINIKNNKYIEYINLARDIIKLREDFERNLIESLNRKFLEDYLTCLDSVSEKEIPENNIDWFGFNIKRHERVLYNVVFDCILYGEEKRLKIYDLFKLVDEGFDVIVSHRDSTLTDRLIKLNLDKKIVIIKTIERYESVFDEDVFESIRVVEPVERRLAEVLKDALSKIRSNVHSYAIMDYLLKNDLAKPCSEHYLDILMTGEVRMHYRLYEFSKNFTDKLFEVHGGDTVILNKNHPLINKLLKIILEFSPEERVAQIMDISGTLCDLHEYIAERDLNVVNKNIVLEILEPLAEKLGIKLTEEDLP